MDTCKQNALVTNLAIVALVLLAGLSLSGCECNRTGMSISAETAQTSIGTPSSFIRVVGRNFAPNASIKLSFRQYPAADPALGQFEQAATTDGAGNFTWVKDLFQLPQRNFSSDPTVDVWITATETSSRCFAITSLKTAMILKPPLR
jgi:hypothetical protein